MNRHKSDTASLQADPDFFRAAVTFTAQRTAFSPRLIEKDYFCTVLLEYLASMSETLIFKGGTCLAQGTCRILPPKRGSGFRDFDAN